MRIAEDYRELRVVDFHTHLLPGIDDGSASPQESRAMLDRMLSEGVETVVLTPHFYPDRESPDEFLARRQRAARELTSVLRQSDPQLYLGAEVAYFDGISASQTVSKLCIQGTSCLLLELPFDKTFCSSVYHDLRMMMSRGFQVVVAHAERYPDWRHKSVRRRFREMGLYIQSTANSFVSKTSARHMRRLWSRGEIDLLGSDCHHAEHREPNLGVAVAALQEYGQTGALMQAFDLAHRLLEGATLLSRDGS